jgi:hypothetical protein
LNQLCLLYLSLRFFASRFSGTYDLDTRVIYASP